MSKRAKGICKVTALRKFVGNAMGGKALSRFVVAALTNGIHIDGVTIIPAGTVLELETDVVHYVDSGVVGRWVEAHYTKRVEKRVVVAVGFKGTHVNVPPVPHISEPDRAASVGRAIRSKESEAYHRNKAACRKLYYDSDMNDITKGMIASGNKLSPKQITAEIEKRHSARFLSKQSK